MITINSNLLRITKLAHNIDARIQVIAVSVANKREQIYKAIPRITTPLTLMANDDIELPPKSLPHILTPLAVIRTEILQSNEFMTGYVTEK
jgi:hypothetical protein